MKIVLKNWRWELILFLGASLAITVFAPEPGGGRVGAFILGYFVACQTSVFPDAVARRFRWTAGIFGFWAVIDFLRTAAAMSGKSGYFQAFLLGNGGYGAFGAYEPLMLFSLDLDGFRSVTVGKEKYEEPFKHWGLAIGLLSTVLTAVTMCVPIMLIGCVIALIVKKARRER